MSGKQMQLMTVKPETALIRPFIVCAVLCGAALDQTAHTSSTYRTSFRTQNFSAATAAWSPSAHTTSPPAGAPSPSDDRSSGGRCYKDLSF
jgi:hypothetical protein